MKNAFIQKLLLSSLSAFALLTGCAQTSTSDTSTAITGQFVDSYVQNIDYFCADGASGMTDANGLFTCTTFPIEFKLGGLKLGEIASLASDNHLFVQDLLGVARTDFTNPSVIAMARLLQSSDEDNNSANGLQIRQEIKTAFTSQVNFNASDINSYATDANITLIDDTTAIAHLTQTTTFVQSISDTLNLPLDLKAALLSSPISLTQELKNTLSYMGNEERLAYDVYNKLYETYPLQQFSNIATKSESTHIQIVQLLVQKYIATSSDFSNIDLTELGYKDVLLSAMVAGSYDIKAIQDLYDVLIAKGSASQQDALEVGCMVEVTDINDLLADIEIAKAENASDILTAFEFLRDGSYSHYWAFDKALKNIGVVDGCCVAGTEYCQPNYPQNSMGNAKH